MNARKDIAGPKEKVASFYIAPPVCFTEPVLSRASHIVHWSHLFPVVKKRLPPAQLPLFARLPVPATGNFSKTPVGPNQQ